MTHASSRSGRREPADEVVLLDERGQPCGAAPRTEVHDHDTPLHLAFSCHLHDQHGRVLITRRALVKRTWPGVWTNAFCGHPRPGEEMTDAIHRYAAHELGVEISDLQPLLPDFRYRAVDASGTVENEVCPVFSARVVHDPRPNPAEVMDLRWLSARELTAAADAAPWALSPWLLEQLNQLTETGGLPEGSTHGRHQGSGRG